MKLQREFRESDVLPDKTEVKLGKLGKFISPANGYFTETYKSQNINPISPTPKFTLSIIQIKVKTYQLVFSGKVNKKINLSVQFQYLTST